jgi:hypothetical protein
LKQGNADKVSQLPSEDYDMEEQTTCAIDTEGSKQQRSCGKVTTIAVKPAAKATRTTACVTMEGKSVRIKVKTEEKDDFELKRLVNPILKRIHKAEGYGYHKDRVCKYS